MLQAKVLWIPNLNAGVDYFRHDGFSQNLFTGGLFQKGRQSFFVGGGPSLNVALTDAIFEPLAARRVVASREANLQAARNDALLTVTQAYFVLQEARGRLVGVDATIVRAQKLVDLADGIGSGADCTAGDQPGEGRVTKLEAISGNRDPGLAGCQRESGGSPSAGSRGFARADRAPVRRDYADPGRPDGHGAGADRAQQPARDRLAEGAARRGRNAITPGKETPILT